jgi:hypothetical protein
MSKLETLLKSIDDFFSDEKNYEQLSTILIDQKISMRKIESFVTKNKHLNVKTPSGSTLNVNVSYKSCLNGYSKKLFDPFCRTERIEYKGLTTTIAQLNFMRWCIKNGIIKTLIEQNHTHSELSV